MQVQSGELIQEAGSQEAPPPLPPSADDVEEPVDEDEPVDVPISAASDPPPTTRPSWQEVQERRARDRSDHLSLMRRLRGTACRVTLAEGTRSLSAVYQGSKSDDSLLLFSDLVIPGLGTQPHAVVRESDLLFVSFSLDDVLALAAPAAPVDGDDGVDVAL